MDINDILNQARKNKKEACSTFRYNTDVRPAKKLPRSNVNPKAIKAFLNKKRDEEIESLKEAQVKKDGLQKIRNESKTLRKANSMAKRTKDNLKVYKGEDVLGLYAEPKKRRRGERYSPPLSPEADRKHKAFMKNLVSKVFKVPGANDDDSDGYREPVLEQDERKIRKMEKHRAKARSASNLEFSDLLQMAEKQKNKADDNSSSSEEEGSDSGEESDGNTDKHGRQLTAEEKYQRERRKRRELEERLKSASSQKSSTASKNTKPSHPNTTGSLAHFKIGKLNSGMSEESKKAKVKALMEKFKKSSGDKQQKSRSVERKNGIKSNSEKDRKMHKSHSTPSLTNLKHKEKHSSNNINSKQNGVRVERSRDHARDPPRSKTSSQQYHMAKSKSSSNLHQSNNIKPKQNCVKGERSRDHIRDSSHSKTSNQQYNNVKSKSSTNSISQKKKLLQKHRPSSDRDLKQTNMDNHFKTKKNPQKSNNTVLPSSSKHKTEPPRCTSNPYKHTVVKATKRSAVDSMTDPWAKSNKGPDSQSKRVKPAEPRGQCTLSVTSVPVPNKQRLDPYIESYKQTGKVLPKLTPEMVAKYKAAMYMKLQREGKIPNGRRPQQHRRAGVIHDSDSDEYDSELEDFIVDDENYEVDNDEVDVSSEIKAIFGYDKSKYGRESEWEISRMDASYKDIEREEKRSLKIAKEEDAREAKLEEERMKKQQKRKR